MGSGATAGDGPWAEVRVDPARCLRCAACAILAPGLFAVERGGARALRPPADADEARGVRAAELTCPTGAIVRPAEARG